MVSLQRFEHFDVISMVDRSTDHGKLLSIFFTIIVTVLASTSVEIPRKMVRGRKRTTNWATITSFPWSVIFIEPSS